MIASKFESEMNAEGAVIGRHQYYQNGNVAEPL